MQIISIVLLILSCLSSQGDTEVYKVHKVINSNYVQIEDTKGNIYDYYQEAETTLKEGMKVIDVDGQLLECKDNNTYSVEIDSYMLIMVQDKIELITPDYIVNIPYNICSDYNTFKLN